MPAARLISNVSATPPPAESLASAASALPGSAALKLDAALSLLSQSGHEPLAGEPGSAAWMQGLIDALCELSSRDALTGLANRRHFEMVLAREIDRVARAGEPALLLMLDIDHFKHVNDSHGHAAGDLVLKAVSEALLECVRPMDTVARIGGEEFAIVLPNCPPAFGPTVRSSVRLWLERADLQLYNAKTSGRNRAVFEPAAVSFVTAEEKGLLFSTSQFDEHDGDDPKDGHA
jgi:diguanylate cyclase